MHESSRKASDEFIGPCAFLAAFERAAGRAVFSVDSKITRKIKHELKLQPQSPRTQSNTLDSLNPKLRIQSLSVRPYLPITLHAAPATYDAGAPLDPEAVGPSARSSSAIRVVVLGLEDLPLVSREWKNGSNSSYNCTPFLHSLLTRGKKKVQRKLPDLGLQI